MPGDDSALDYLQTPQMPTHILQGQTQHNTLKMSSVLKLNFVLYKCYLFNGVPPPPWLLLQVKPETFMQSFFLRHAQTQPYIKEGTANISNQITVIKDSKCYSGSHHRYNKETQQELINSACGTWQDAPDVAWTDI